MKPPPLPGWPSPHDGTLLIGVFPGEGIGPEVVPAALELLPALARGCDRQCVLRHGGPIGKAAQAMGKSCLPDEAADFASDIFTGGGALFCGPGGDRFVYELRARFDLYCKFSPLQPQPALVGLGPLRAERLVGADILAVRENASGLYQGGWSLEGKPGTQVARHWFCYREAEVDRILAAGLAQSVARRRRLAVVVKEAGVPSVARLWCERALALGGKSGVAVEVLDIDNAVFQLIAEPQRFDVIVASNMFGDVLADAGALLLGSRGLAYSGNFGPDGRAAYQTGHGAAWDIAGRGIANPLAQMLSLAMMLEISFGLADGAAAIRGAIDKVLAAGVRTRDIAEPGCETVDTAGMARRVRVELERILGLS